MSEGRPAGARLEPPRLRPARPEDLPACLRLWREAINDYTRQLALPDIPPENPGPARLHAHTLATDPERFWLAVRDADDGEAAVAFGSAALRGNVWFLSMLFVDPAEQARGLGRAILDRIMPRPDRDGRQGGAAVLATATDSAQPVSNGLYASLGIVPRVPLFNLIGRPRPDRPFPALPAGLAVERLDQPARSLRSLDDEIDALDRTLLGFDHHVDHEYVRLEPRSLLVYRDARTAELAGYGYAGAVGRVGPIAARREELLAPILGHVLNEVEPRGASSVWLPGTAGDAVSAALQAGLRMEAFPILLAWSRDFADFRRYVPMSPGLL